MSEELKIKLKQNDLDVAKEIIFKLTTVDEKIGKDEKTALLIASELGVEEIISILIKMGANINATDKFGYTPLLWATVGGHTVVVRKLIEANAELNICDRYGFSPLHFASLYNYFSIVEILLDNGADKFAVTRKGKTADEIAATEEIKEFILRHVFVSFYVLK